MLTTKQIYTFLTEWSHMTNIEVNSLIKITSKHLQANVVFLSSAGIVISKSSYLKKQILSSQTTEIPVIHCNQQYGKLIVYKSNLTTNERILLEILAGLITCQIYDHQITKNHTKVYN